MLLAAGELAGQIVQLLLQTQGGDYLVHIILIYFAAVQLDGQDNVLPHSEHRHQVKALEHEADLPAAEDGEGLVLQRENILAVYNNGAVGGPVQPAQHVEQGGFA